jgi:hypothetical protein
MKLFHGICHGGVGVSVLEDLLGNHLFQDHPGDAYRLPPSSNHSDEIRFVAVWI